MDDIVNSLQAQASVMEKDLDDWKCELSLHRDHFYELNYFTTPQLLSLREELGQFKGIEISAKPVKQEVMTLLQCISRHLSSDLVKDEVQTVNGLLAEQKFLQEQFSHGKPSHSYSMGYEPPVRSPSDNSNALSIGMDHNMSTLATELYTQTIENRAASIPGAKLVAKILQTASVGPQPKLTDKDLTDKQKAILDNLKELCGFSRKLILFAFERCSRPDIEEAVMNWCNDKQDDFDFIDSDAGSDAVSDADTEQYEYNEDEKMQSEEDTNTDDTKFDEVVALHEAPPPLADPVPYYVPEKLPVRPLEPWTLPPPLPHSSSHHSLSHPVSHLAPKVKIIDHKPISEDDPIVSALIGSGFSPEESFAAAEQYPDNLDRAMAFLMEDPSESGDDSVTIGRQGCIGEYQRQISEDSDEEK